MLHHWFNFQKGFLIMSV